MIVAVFRFLAGRSGLSSVAVTAAALCMASGTPAAAAPLSTSIAEDGSAALTWSGWRGTQVLVSIGQPGALSPLRSVEEEDGIVTDVRVVAEPGGGARVVWRVITSTFNTPRSGERGVIRSARIDPDGTVTRDGDLLDTFVGSYTAATLQMTANARGDVVVTTSRPEAESGSEIASGAVAGAGQPFAQLDVVGGSEPVAALGPDGIAVILDRPCESCPQRLRERSPSGDIGAAFPAPTAPNTYGQRLSRASDGTILIGDESRFYIRPPGGTFHAVDPKLRVSALMARNAGEATFVGTASDGGAAVSDVAADGRATLTGLTGLPVTGVSFAGLEDGSALVGLPDGRVLSRTGTGPFSAARDSPMTGVLPTVAYSRGGQLISALGNASLTAAGQVLAEQGVASDPKDLPEPTRLRVYNYVLRQRGRLGVPISCFGDDPCRGDIRIGRVSRRFHLEDEGRYVWLKRDRLRTRTRVRVIVERRYGQARTFSRRLVARNPGCGLPWAQTIATAPRVRLRLAAFIDVDGAEAQEAYACPAGKRGRVVASGYIDRYGGTYLADGAINQRYAAVLSSSGSPSGSDQAMHITDIATGLGKRLTLVDSGASYVVNRYLLGDHGSVALTDTLDGRTRVRVIGIDGSDRIIDAGPGVDFSSLRLQGNTVTWTRDGELQEAGL